MRKVVKVDEMIATARGEVDRARKYLANGNYDVLNRVYGMIRLITIVSTKDTEDWKKEWDKIQDMIIK